MNCTFKMEKDTDMIGIRMFIGLFIIFFSTSVYAECYQLYGHIQLEESELCEGPDQDPDEPYIGTEGTCFKVNCIGNALFHGSAGLTFSPVTSAVQGETSTPLSFSLDGRRAGLQFFTSRSYLKGIILTRNGILIGSIKTADTGTMDRSDGMGAEILLIQGGKGDFENASGRILVYGPEIAPGWATYKGKVCIDE